MLKKIFIILVSSFVLSSCSFGIKKSGIEVISNPNVKVIINNKDSGSTPYKNNSLVPGEINIKLQNSDKRELSKKIELQNKVNTVINWDFGKSENESGGYFLSMEKTGDSKKAGLLVNVNPDKAAVSIDGEIKGFSPIKIDDIGDGDKQVTLSFPGYKSINLYIKAVKGYQLIIDSKLAQDVPIIEEVPETPIAISTVSRVKIKQTETGWLRVRKESNNNSTEVARVKPNDTFDIIEENTEWYRIDLGNNKNGWISNKYAEKL